MYFPVWILKSDGKDCDKIQRGKKKPANKLERSFHPTELLAALLTWNSAFINCYFIRIPAEHALVRMSGNSKTSCYSKCYVRNSEKKRH